MINKKIFNVKITMNNIYDGKGSIYNVYDNGYCYIIVDGEYKHNCILYRYADIVKHGKAKYIDFTSGTRKPGITKESSDYAFTRVYSIIPDPDIDIYEKSGKIKSNPLGVCPAGRYNWLGLVEEDK